MGINQDEWCGDFPPCVLAGLVVKVSIEFQNTRAKGDPVVRGAERLYPNSQTQVARVTAWQSFRGTPGRRAVRLHLGRPVSEWRLRKPPSRAPSTPTWPGSQSSAPWRLRRCGGGRAPRTPCGPDSRFRGEGVPDIPKSEPHRMVAFLLEQRGLAPKDLWPVVGSKSRVSEILGGKRPMTTERMRQGNYRVDKGGGLAYRRAAAQAVGVSPASR